MEYFLELILLAATSSLFLRIGKFLDFRLGGHKISALKKNGRLEKLWFGIAKQSLQKVAFRVLEVVEYLFYRAFGANLFSRNGLLRFIAFSLCVNLMLALSAIVLSAPQAMLTSYLIKVKLIKTVAFLVVINIPLDLAAYLCTRFAIRTAMNKPLRYIIGLVIGAILASYSMIVLSTAIGATLTIFGLMDGGLELSITSSLLAHWLPLAVHHPFTSQVALNGINVGYLALGALPSIAVLCATLFFMLFLQTLAKWLHYELCVNVGRMLDDKKSFFELIALIASAFLFVLWGTLWILSNFLKLLLH